MTRIIYLNKFFNSKAKNSPEPPKKIYKWKKYSQVFGQGTSVQNFSQIPKFFEVSTPFQATPFRTQIYSLKDKIQGLW